MEPSPGQPPLQALLHILPRTVKDGAQIRKGDSEPQGQAQEIDLMSLRRLGVCVSLFDVELAHWTIQELFFKNVLLTPHLRVRCFG